MLSHIQKWTDTQAVFARYGIKSLSETPTCYHIEARDESTFISNFFIGLASGSLDDASLVEWINAVFRRTLHSIGKHHFLRSPGDIMGSFMVDIDICTTGDCPARTVCDGHRRYDGLLKICGFDTVSAIDTMYAWLVDDNSTEICLYRTRLAINVAAEAYTLIDQNAFSLGDYTASNQIRQKTCFTMELQILEQPYWNLTLPKARLSFADIYLTILYLQDETYTENAKYFIKRLG
ncbi:hypothetical protein CHS0354_033490 [Potamilus streckersoni]|uniref:Uncharacterized protein n=1 Tax=Potamilus streckersoni TaxID=2493646 RepID=A0AAE0SAX5_9BIVA|nr:hypothetical protein CHS0354_033490 [Potamilus streckersoni]